MLDDDNRTETLPVDDDCCALAGEADVLSRQSHERVGCGEREVDGGLDGVEAGDVRALVGAALILPQSVLLGMTFPHRPAA